ncbi:LysM peptidoglycan-binding domain-containing protein [Peribacillus saganii]|uniref:LysM peptidoglycan-binding domain-containing protein n=1 Tax=Peribacillus saganii TaxID=2303992 RepID=A0A372LIW3_9BACI|nr:LysM peptidoglycan-binding domain-containing protein [Peribacillus saganii]RFU66337.1 LysM peptidoglycan-binding domain-containing protein [Peribacillus saganii]
MAVHVVKYGDTLWAISKRYNVSVENIVAANGLPSPSGIVPGLALYIPERKHLNRGYRIKPGDTLWSVSRRYGTTVDQILAANPGVEASALVTGRVIEIPSPYKKQVTTLGFILPRADGTITPNLAEAAPSLSYAAIVAYTFTEQGTAIAQAEDRPIITSCRQLNVNPLLMIRNIQNGTFNGPLVGTVLGNTQYRRNLASSVASFVRQKNYAGVSVDFEYVPPANRGDFVLFLRELKAAIAPKLLHVNIHAKTSDQPQNPITGGHDYRAIGQVADLVAVMTIEYGYVGGPPNPITPVDWMEQVLIYSVSRIPPGKIQAAMPLYSYDWALPSNKVTSRAVLAAQNLAISKGVTIKFSAAQATPWYRYSENNIQHIVWFEDIRSIIAKYRLMDSYDLAGMTYWHLALSFPQNWLFVRNNLLVIK